MILGLAFWFDEARGVIFSGDDLMEYKGLWYFKDSRDGELDASDLPELKRWLVRVVNEFDGEIPPKSAGFHGGGFLGIEDCELWFRPGGDFSEYVVEYMSSTSGFTSANQNAVGLAPEEILRYDEYAHSNDQCGYGDVGGTHVNRLDVVSWQQLWMAIEDFVLDPLSPSNRVMWRDSEGHFYKQK